MSLFKQLIGIIFVVQSLVFSLFLFENYHSIYDFAKNQLEKDAKHTANSLGLSITSLGNIEDIELIKTMINSLYDSGFYQLIELKDVDGKELIKKEQTLTVQNVPKWFVDMFPMPTPKGETELMNGWMPFGTLSIITNPSIAYYQMWNSFKGMSIYFIIILTLGSLFLYALLKLLLNPLNKIKEQALMILENDFVIQEKIPYTTELKAVVKSMNEMVEKVKSNFNKEIKTIEKYHNLLYKDETTGLYNRRYFNIKAQEFINDTTHDFYLYLISFNSTENDLVQKLGYQKKELYLKEVSLRLLNFNAVFTSKISDNDFVVVFPCDVNPKEMAHNILISLHDINTIFELESIWYNIGITILIDGKNLKQSMIEADSALRKCLSKEYTYSLFEEENNKKILGKEEWKIELEKALEEKRFIFAYQNVFNVLDNTIYQQELYLRLKDKDNTIYMANYFFPMINELKLNEKVDFYVLEQLKVLNFNRDIAVNIDTQLLTKTENWKKLEKVIYQLSMITSHKVYIEIVLNNSVSTTLLSDFSKLLRSKNFGLGIDNMIIDPNNLATLQMINPDYVKINQSSLMDIYSQINENSIINDSLNMIMNNMNINLIAIGVETEEVAQALKKLGITYMQGNYFHISQLRENNG